MTPRQRAETQEDPRPIEPSGSSPGKETGQRRARRRTSPRCIYQLKVTLRGSKPPIWRRLQVGGDITLAGLHTVVQIAMGWLDSHLHRFEINGVDYGGSLDDELSFHMRGSAGGVLQRLVPAEGSTFLYEYDFGDGWIHAIKVERILPPQEGVTYPVCLAGRRAGPPEDCGGIWGYYDLLEIIGDPSHEHYAEMMEWLGGEWDPEWFSVEEVNEGLRRCSW